MSQMKKQTKNDLTVGRYLETKGVDEIGIWISFVKISLITWQSN